MWTRVDAFHAAAREIQEVEEEETADNFRFAYRGENSSSDSGSDSDHQHRVTREVRERTSKGGNKEKEKQHGKKHLLGRVYSAEKTRKIELI